MDKLNSMCTTCARLGNDCKGTTCQTWAGCVYCKPSLAPGDVVEVHLYGFGREIITRNHGKCFTVLQQSGKLGIMWNTERIPYTCKGEEFTPFNTFAQSVIFERQSDGVKFCFSNIANRLVLAEVSA